MSTENSEQIGKKEDISLIRVEDLLDMLEAKLPTHSLAAFRDFRKKLESGGQRVLENPPPQAPQPSESISESVEELSPLVKRTTDMFNRLKNDPDVLYAERENFWEKLNAIKTKVDAKEAREGFGTATGGKFIADGNGEFYVVKLDGKFFVFPSFNYDPNWPTVRAAFELPPLQGHFPRGIELVMPAPCKQEGSRREWTFTEKGKMRPL
ncbi:MAG: hypothetical protein CEN90_82 [Parcubacteria group bacterium Licking1014_17]|nr:MAG: hypothetical protein CEN90_82 [Parcubacteria group bacterium Licking1014_17]